MVSAVQLLQSLSALYTKFKEADAMVTLRYVTRIWLYRAI